MTPLDALLREIGVIAAPRVIEKPPQPVTGWTPQKPGQELPF